MYSVDAPSQQRQRLRAGRHQMFLSTVNGRYWVELVDPVTADVPVHLPHNTGYVLDIA